MYRALIFLILAGLFGSSYQQQNHTESIHDIFGDPNVGAKNPTVPSTGECECVPYYLCKNDSTINKNGEGIIDIRVEESSCASYLDVCCYPEAKQDKPIPPPPVIRTGCGARNTFGVGFRITGDKDNETQFGELPWMVAIILEENVEGHDELLNVYQCGGALIHPQIVLTSAHCVAVKGKVYKIRAGEWDTQTTKEIYPHQDRDVKTVVVHPQYHAGALFNDIALLFLESPVELAPNVDLICLPSQNEVIPPGVRCFVSGWGKDVFEAEGQYQSILKKIAVPIVDRDVCQADLRKTRLGKHFELDKSFICAGGEEGKDACKGDGGSPLVCPIPDQNNRYQQIGIVAWGIGCGVEQVPGVYANVPLFIDWINEQISKQNLNLSLNQY